MRLKATCLNIFHALSCLFLVLGIEKFFEQHFDGLLLVFASQPPHKGVRVHRFQREVGQEMCLSIGIERTNKSFILFL